MRLHWIIGQILALLVAPRFIYILPLLANAALLVPLPILLAFIYKAGGSLTFTRRLRHTALVTALVYGVFLAAPDAYGWALALQRNLTNIRLEGQSTVAANLRNWFRTSDSVALFWSTTIIFSEVAFLFFLVAVFRRSVQRLAPPTAQHLRYLLGAAQVATVAGALAVLLNIGQQIYTAINFFPWQSDFHWMTRTQFILRNAVGAVWYLCWAVAPWIVYKGIRGDPRNEAA